MNPSPNLAPTARSPSPRTPEQRASAPGTARPGAPELPAGDTPGPLLDLGYAIRDFDRFPVAPFLRAGSPRLYEQCTDIMTRTREYAARHLTGRVEGWDQQAARDHTFVPWSAIDAALPYRFLSLNVPGPFGGCHGGPLAAAVFAEELAAADAGIYVIYGAHALAWSLIMASLDLGVIARFGREIADGEKNGRPILLALAHTEPTAGSDVEDIHDIAVARLGSRYEKVAGGYRLNARKVFISNGSIARYNVVTAIEDPRHPLETMRGFLVPNDAAGFSVGRLEHKMGQRLSTAVEVLCDDVFVPADHSFDLGDAERTVDTTLSLSRGPVGAMATGIIRGTLERTLRHLARKRVRGHFLYEEQWVTLALADMLGALQAARGLYMDAAFAGESWGLGKMLDFLPGHVPEAVSGSAVLHGLLGSAGVVQSGRALYESFVGEEPLRRLLGHASMAKFMCSDLSVDVAMKAMEILGEDANDPEWGVEKCMRDAKLGQIFEGTNQINRLHVARGLLSRR